MQAPQPQQTPLAARPASAAGAAGPASWLADLDAYTSVHEHGGAARRELAAAVKAAPQSAEAWRGLLAHEEAHGASQPQQQQQQHGGAAAGRVSLYHLYFYATQLVPRGKNQHKEAYLQLWLGFARQQWSRSPDDARDTFKTLKNQDIGGASAHLYHQWAALEHSAGNVSKALGILAKGLRAEAQPASLLEQLRAEMQSGTFDLKAAAAFTETITIDTSSAAARALAQQADATPAPALAAPAARAPACPGAAASSAARPAAAAPAGVASCLKGSAAAVAAAHAGAPEHASGRAVTFAADVRDATHDDCSRRPGHSAAGPASASSARSSARSDGGHSACLSASSSSSRSPASVHDGAFLPFAASTTTTSYKSSTTETSGLDGSEEDTISCRATASYHGATGAGSKDPGASKPSTAPLASHGSAHTPGSALGSSTATLGLKRFGFKSRALRVGGEAPGPTPAPAGQPAAPQPGANVRSGSIAAAAAAAGAAHVHDRAPPTAHTAAAAAAAEPAEYPAPAAMCEAEGTGGRKRRAGHGSTPSPKTSPKLPATSKDGGAITAAAGGQQGTATQAGGAGIQTASMGLPELHTPPPAALASGSGGRALGANRATEGGAALAAPSLAAPVPQHHKGGTPPSACEAAGKPGGTGWQGEWTPPAEGQLPSSLDSTPELLQGGSPGAVFREHAAGAAAAGRDGAGRGGADGLPLARGGGASAAATNRTAATSGSRAAEQANLPTLVLPDTTQQRPQQQQREQQQHRPQQQQQQQHRTQQPAAPVAREPLRPLQMQQQQQGNASWQPAAADPVAGKHRGESTGKASAAAAQPAPPPPAPPVGQQQQVQAQAVLEDPQQQQLAVRQSRPREDAQTVYVQGVRYTKLECVGRGGSSKVFKVMGPSCKIFALKRIRLAGRDAEAASGFIDEIELLRRLRDAPNIIQLVDSQVFQAEGLIYMVQEYGEIDLARLLAKHDAARRAAGGGAGAGDHGALLQGDLDENFIRLYWQQMLQAVSGVHAQRIVHSDLKPANFLLVEGQLKLIDFGIAKAISGDTTSIARESQVGTLNYMSPEAILGGTNNILGGPAMRVGRPSDVWSLGCILYQMVYGRTPFASLPFLPKMHAICNPQHQVAYPPVANGDLMDVMRRCLDRDPKTRITLQELLDHPFLHPNRRPAPPAPALPPAVGLSEEQMKQLVAQVAAAGAAGVADIDKLTRELMQKLSGPSAPRA